MHFLKSSNVASILAAVFLLAPAMTHAREHPSPPAVVVRYCSGCHGVDGKSQLPYIPRLAGLSAAYSQSKIASFRAAASLSVDEAFERFVNVRSSGKENGFTLEANIHMVGAARTLSERDLHAAALWYSKQPPAPGRTGKRQLIEEGKDLYLNGLQSRQIPACQSCHGSEAQGTRTTPRLAGQNASYIVGQLAHFRTDDNRRTPMTDIARSLETGQARALAAYLQSR